MFCPKCGQPQVSEAVRFCSRCGLPLGDTASLLANDGLSSAPFAAQTGVGESLSPRRKGVRQGGAALLIGIFLVPMIALMHVIIGLPGEFVVIGLLVALLGLLRLSFAMIFESKSPRPQPFAPQTYAQPAQLNPTTRRGALPPAEFRPSPGFFAPRNDTAEIAQPSSVTDHTTRLLQDDNATDR
jgi:hypothetical protein